MSTTILSGVFDLDSKEMFGSALENAGFGNSAEVRPIHFIEPGYQGNIDYRIRQLSYSALGTLHSCPRKFQLNRLRTTHRAEEDLKQTITFSFGHIVGEAIQLALAGKTEEEIIWKMFLMWKPELLAEETRDKKSFWLGVIALQRFLALRAQGFMDEYELVYYQGKPACELSFCIILPDGFRLRGHVDAVLRHKVTGEILVLEAKTTKLSSLSDALYKNSSQAIGYSTVLDVLFPELTSYTVLYLVYQTGTTSYTPMPFTKSFSQRADWIRGLLMDVDLIKTYEEQELYPSRGESCYAFFRECEYFQTCQLSTQYLTKPCTPEEEDKVEYQITLTLEQLVDSQLSKVAVAESTELLGE